MTATDRDHLGTLRAIMSEWLIAIVGIRNRFTDLRKVYALDGGEKADVDLEHRWNALAVTPLRYTAPKHDHSALWRDLSKLADLVEQPGKARKRLLHEIVSKPFVQANEAMLSRVHWLIRESTDLWKTLVESVEDAAWLDHLVDRKLIQTSEAFALTEWCARNWMDRVCIQAAAGWANKLHPAFREQLGLRLERSTIEQPWKTAWRAIQNVRPRTADIDLEAFRLKSRIADRDCLDSDLRAAVDLFVPRVDMRARRDADQPKSIKHVRDMLSVRLVGAEGGGPTEIRALLTTGPHQMRVLDIATAGLETVIADAGGLGLIDRENESSDWDVPSVEDHRQNEFHDGYMPLIRLLADTFDAADVRHRDELRRIALRWRHAPARIGTRLYYYALRKPELFSAEEVGHAIQDALVSDFWNIRRELVKLIEQRLKEVPPEQVDAISDRVLREGPTRFRGPSETSSETDWRPAARAQAMWLRLSAIAKRAKLSREALAQLGEIKATYKHLDRDYREQDLFSSWVGPVRSIAGRPAKLVKADPSERIQVARDLERRGNWEDRDSWGAFCMSDPRGAFDALKIQGAQSQDAKLWEQLFHAVTPLGEGAGDARHRQFLQEILDATSEVDDAFVAGALDGIVWLHIRAVSLGCRVRAHWWSWLWKVASTQEEDEFDWSGGEALLSRAINSPQGRLIEQLLGEIQARRRTGGSYRQADRKALETAATATGFARRMAMAVFARYAGYLSDLSPGLVDRVLKPHLLAADSDAIACREIMLVHSRLGMAATRKLKDVIFLGVSESDVTGAAAIQVAAKLLIPAVNNKLGRGKPNWAITAEEVRPVLSCSSRPILDGAADVLRQLLHRKGQSPAEMWRKAIGPVFAKAWPVERIHRSASTTVSAKFRAPVRLSGAV